jgi:hypothetical protein
MENMSGLEFEHDGYPMYGYPRQTTASPGQLYCSDNEYIRITMPKGAVRISYDIYFENETECLRVTGHATPHTPHSHEAPL